MFTQRIPTRVNICSVVIHWAGGFVTLNLVDPTPNQNLFEAQHAGLLKKDDIYFTKSTFRLTENGNPTDSGMVYQQEASFRFPSMDHNRSARLYQLHGIKYLEFGLSNGDKFIMGRNDIQQNTAPVVSTTSDLNFTEVKINCESVFPLLRVATDSVISPGYDYTYNFELA